MKLIVGQFRSPAWNFLFAELFSSVPGALYIEVLHNIH